MGNSVPHIPLEEINLTPGNVLIQVNGNASGDAQSLSKGEGATYYHNLIRGRVIRVCSEYGASAAAGYPDRSVTYLKPGDEVWVRAHKGFPVDIGNKMRLYVVNEWDVAIKLESPNSSSSNEWNYQYTTVSISSSPARHWLTKRDRP